MKYFATVLLLALFAVAMASDVQPAKEEAQVEVATKPSIAEAVRDKRGAIVVNSYAVPYTAYSPYTYYPYYRYPSYSYPYGSIY